ncbi:MAG: acetyl ornithine aminotransferase family protein [Herpetosiphonaceae bacterium]|nr:acetyl ornithine aminotransferase family protein [Herpetosiphonaceae bacterium]
MVERDTAVMVPCSGRVYPFVMERGAGCEVWDIDGNRYLDLNAGIAVVSTGHSHPRIVQAIQDQAAKFIHMAGTDFYNEPMVKAAEKLTSLMPGDDEWQVFFSNSGTEAVEAAVKLARYATKRQNIIGFYGAFHGRSYGSLSITASKPYQRKGFFPLMPGVFHAFYANPFRPPWDVDPEQVAQYALDFIEHTLFTTTTPPEDVAAIIAEPIQGEGGYIVPPHGFWQGLRDICDRYGILLIADEVQSGIGRTGKMWAIEHENVVPDIITTAKGLGSGLPVGAMVARREIASVWKPGAHGNTYGGNALAMRAVYETLSVVEEGLMENAGSVGSYFMSRLHELEDRFDHIGDVRGRGLMIGMDFVKDQKTREPHSEMANAVMEEAFRRGLLLLTCGKSTIRFCPPLVLTKEQVDEGIQLLSETLEAVGA